MSATTGAIARRSSIPLHRLVPLALLWLAVAVVAASLTSAEVPNGAIRLSRAQAGRAGVAVGLIAHRLGTSDLVEIDAGTTNMTLLAVSRDGASAALADRVGDASGSLTIAHADGSQVLRSLPGLLGATFVPAGDWVAVVDGRGGLWRIDSLSGGAALLADGPFIGAPVVARDGSLLLLAVPSVEAPYRSQLIRLDPDGGTTPLTADDLVYAAYPLDDGALAVVDHQPGGTVVQRLGAGVSSLLAHLGHGAVNVVVSPDGRIAFERAGAVFDVDRMAAPHRIGSGTRPCLAADGSALLIHRSAESVVVGMDGQTLFTTARPSALAGAAGCLP